MKNVLIVAMCLMACGCGKRREKAETPLQADESTYVCTILFDLSGSFYEKMTEGGMAYQFSLAVIDKYFRDRIGSDDKLIIAQIGGHERALLWQGSPTQLRQQFGNAKAFSDFIREKALGSSNIYQSIDKTVSYVTSDQTIRSGQAKGAVFVLSDMLDTSNSEAEKQAALDAIAKFGQTGGTIGIYYVDQLLVPEWRDHMDQSGVKHWCVEADFVGRPILPSFE